MRPGLSAAPPGRSRPKCSWRSTTGRKAPDRPYPSPGKGSHLKSKTGLKGEIPLALFLSSVRFKQSSVPWVQKSQRLHSASPGFRAPRRNLAGGGISMEKKTIVPLDLEPEDVEKREAGATDGALWLGCPAHNRALHRGSGRGSEAEGSEGRHVRGVRLLGSEEAARAIQWRPFSARALSRAYCA
jgi:hypothetical protein